MLLNDAKKRFLNTFRIQIAHYSHFYSNTSFLPANLIHRSDYLNAICPARPTDIDRLRNLRTRYCRHFSWSFTSIVLTLKGLEVLLKTKRKFYLHL